MFFDLTKETMLSIEMKDGYDLIVFHERQIELVSNLTQLISKKKTYK